MSREQFERRLFGGIKWASIVVLLAIVAFPLLYMILLSFKPIAELLRNPLNPMPRLEDVLSHQTYREVLRPVDQGGYGFLTYIRNSLVISLATVAISLTFGVLGAYAASRLRFFGNRAINGGIILTYMFPPIVMAIPLFVLFSIIQLRTSLLGLTVVYLAQTLPISLYMLRSYFLTIPPELEEAARVDGCTRLGTIRHVVVPLAAPAIAAVGLFVFMIAWNEFLYALLFVVGDRSLWTLSLGVQQLDSFEVPKTVLMAGAVLVSLPIILIFFLAERSFTEGLTAGGVKG